MNKLKEQLRLRMLGQLSDENTEANVNIAFDACKDFSLSFLSFLRENYELHDTPVGSFWTSPHGKRCTEEELFNKFLEQYERHNTPQV